MKIWFKLFDDSQHLLKDETVEIYDDDTRTHKVFRALEEACLRFDLSKPIWLDATIDDFRRRGKARFTKDNFVEDIDFDYMEMQVLEEDW